MSAHNADSEKQRNKQIQLIMASQDSDDQSRAQLDIPLIMISAQDADSTGRGPSAGRNSARSKSKLRPNSTIDLGVLGEKNKNKKKVSKKLSSYSNSNVLIHNIAGINVAAMG